MGATAIALIYSPWGKRSGTHLNPAVTLCFLRLGKTTTVDAICYIAGQFVGGALGVLISQTAPRAIVSDPAVNYIVTVPGLSGVTVAWIAEFGMALGLMAIIRGINRVPKLMPYTGCFAGLSIALFVTFESPISGMSINPARTMGSALFARLFTGIWICFAAPVAGMLAAVEIYRAFIEHPQRLCGKLSHSKTAARIHRCNCLVHSGIQAGHLSNDKLNQRP